MNDFDQGGRFQVKNNGQAHFAWLFPRANETMRFSHWLDAQSAPRPGEPDRRCDTIAEVAHREGLTHPRATVIELFTRPDSEALDRVGEYLWRYRREVRHGPQGEDRYPFLAALIFLTGTCVEKEVRAFLPGEEGLENTLKARVLEMETLDAVAFLDDIQHDRLSASLLTWTPLMRNGQAKDTAARWLTLSLALPEAKRRDAAALALTFSDLTDSKDVWKPVLETVTMNESPVFREVRLGVQKENLLEVLRARLSGEDLTAALARVEQESDLNLLSRWFKTALKAAPEDILSQLQK